MCKIWRVCLFVSFLVLMNMYIKYTDERVVLIHTYFNISRIKNKTKNNNPTTTTTKQNKTTKKKRKRKPSGFNGKFINPTCWIIANMFPVDVRCQRVWGFPFAMQIVFQSNFGSWLWLQRWKSVFINLTVDDVKPMSSSTTQGGAVSISSVLVMFT